MAGYDPVEILGFTRFKYQERLKVLERRPGYCTWEVTNACNLNCLHCLLPDAGARTDSELSTEQGLALIDNLAKAGVESLLLSGGEPTLRKDLASLVRHASPSMAVSLNSNGWLLADCIEELREAGLTSVQISIDGATPGTHDFLRGPGSHERAVASLRKCKTIGLAQVSIISVVHRRNVGELSALIDWAFESGADFFAVNTFVPVGRGAASSHLALDPIERKQVYELLVKKQEEGKKVAADDPCMYVVNHHVRQALEDPANSLVSVGCGAGITGCAVRPDGVLISCPGLRVPAGDLKTGQLLSLWRSSPVFKRLRAKSDLRGKCGACEYQYVCGGCRASGLQNSGDLMGEDNLCWHNPGVDPDADKARRTLPDVFQASPVERMEDLVGAFLSTAGYEVASRPWPDNARAIRQMKAAKEGSRLDAFIFGSVDAIQACMPIVNKIERDWVLVVPPAGSATLGKFGANDLPRFPARNLQIWIADIEKGTVAPLLGCSSDKEIQRGFSKTGDGPTYQDRLSTDQSSGGDRSQN